MAVVLGLPLVQPWHAASATVRWSTAPASRAIRLRPTASGLSLRETIALPETPRAAAGVKGWGDAPLPRLMNPAFVSAAAPRWVYKAGRTVGGIAVTLGLLMVALILFAVLK